MDGILRIDKVVATFDIWLDADVFPVPKMKVKILERSKVDFLAVGNLHRRDSDSGYPEYLSGLGETVASALHDFLGNFVADVREHTPAQGFLSEDFEWSAHEDF